MVRFSVRSVTIGAIGAASVLAAAVAWAVPALAASGTLVVTDGSAAPGGQGTVQVVANVGEPGLGAWSMDVVYDTAIIDAVDCSNGVGSVCSPESSEDTVRLAGAWEGGHVGETVLGTFTFQCGDDLGSSPLTLLAADEEHPFADASEPPQPIDVEIMDGTFTCAEATATVEPTEEEPTSTPAAGTLPDTGGGFTGSTGDSIGWVIVALAAAGLAGVAGYGALRLRAR